MRVREVLNSNTDLQGHSRLLVMLPVDRPHTICYHSPITTMLHLYRSKSLYWKYSKGQKRSSRVRQ